MLTLLVLTLATLRPIGLPVEDVASAVADLEAARVERRAAAQDWLAVHLARSDFPTLVASLDGAGAETEARLAQALGSDDRHLGLAVLLLTDTNQRARKLGRQALEEMILRFAPHALDPPLEPGTLPEDWDEANERRLAIVPHIGALADVVSRLDRLGGGGVPIVLLPELDPGVLKRAPDLPDFKRNELVGPWSEVLEELCSLRRVRFSYFGPERAGDRRGAFIRIERAGERGEATAASLLIEWCEGVERALDERWNVACARSLAATTWPAVLAWFEESWLADGDEAALEGLLAAAQRGRVVSSLSTRAGVTRILNDVDRRLDAFEPGALLFAERAARALALVGPSDPRGASLVPAVLAGWDDLSERQRWVRLVALEGLGRQDGSARARAAEVLAGAGSSSLRLQAVNCLYRIAGTSGADLVVAEPLTLFEHAMAKGHMHDLSHELMALAAKLPPGDWAQRVTEPTRLQIAWLGWALHSGAHDQAREFLRALLAGEADRSALVRHMRRWASLGQRAALETLLSDTALADGDEQVARERRRLALRVGLADEAERDQLLERALAADGTSAERWIDLGALCGFSASSTRACAAFVQAFGQGVAAEVLEPGLAVAFTSMRRERLDWELETFRDRCKSAAQRAQHALLSVLQDKDWPLAAPAVPRRLELDDRVLDF